MARAAVSGPSGRVAIVRLLVDTGARYTMLPTTIADSLGCDLQHPVRYLRLMAVDSLIDAPVVAVSWFHCLGQRLDNLQVVVHSLPASTPVDGLLGMDFLIQVGAVLAVRQGEIRRSQR